MTNPAFRFAPFIRVQQSGYKDANDRDDDGLSNDDGAARQTAQFIRDAYREASGEKPVGDDDDDGIEASVGKAYAKPVRTLLAALRGAR